MELSKELVQLVDRSSRLLQEPNDLNDDVISALQQTIKLIATHQDYPAYLKLNLEHDFAYLPNEIVHDVIELASDERSEYYDTLALIEGSWAEWSDHFAKADRSLRSTCIGEKTNFQEFKAKAPELYEEITFHNVDEQVCNILELIGCRLSKIVWIDWSEQRSEATLRKVKNFLKRQLTSKYIRKLIFRSELETEELNVFFVDFVQRAQFEELDMTSLSPLPFEVFEEAFKCWEATKHASVRSKRIFSTISEETAEKIVSIYKVELQTFDEFRSERSVEGIRLNVMRDRIYGYCSLKINLRQH